MSRQSAEQTMDALLRRLRSDHPHITFAPGEQFCWSPGNSTVMYATPTGNSAVWALLHEVAHALLGHTAYGSDFELLRLEVQAWEKAKALAADYGHRIEEDHIQDCLDTYRDWLHQRATCPECGSISLQTDSQRYECFNCRAAWKVTASRFCRPYRQLQNPKPEARNSKQAPKKKSETVQALFS